MTRISHFPFQIFIIDTQVFISIQATIIFFFFFQLHYLSPRNSQWIRKTTINCIWYDQSLVVLRIFNNLKYISLHTWKWEKFYSRSTDIMTFDVIFQRNYYLKKITLVWDACNFLQYIEIMYSLWSLMFIDLLAGLSTSSKSKKFL